MDTLTSSYSKLVLATDTEDEYDVESEEEVAEGFRFFSLPPELRRKILDYVFDVGKTLDIDLRVIKLLSKFPVSSRFYEEATQSFYGTNTFRLLPTHGRAAHKSAVPLIRCFNSYSRFFITSLEFRLGPFWTNPPRCWQITDAMGLEDCESLRVLKVFVEIDPSHAIFNGFRSARLSYTEFAGTLLREIVQRLPNVTEVEFDGYPSVTRDLPLMTRLIQVAVDEELRISWGPGQKNNAVLARSTGLNQGMVPFYSSSPLYRHLADETSAIA